MHKLILFFSCCLTASIANAQFTYKIKADSVRITNDSCSAELILENSTNSVQGFLCNRGKGRTEFRKVLNKINDTTYLVGADTLRFTSGVVTSAWRLSGNAGTSATNNFLGTTDSVHLVFRTKNIERARITANGNMLVGNTPDAGYKLDVNGDSRFNGITVGRGLGNNALNQWKRDGCV